MATDDIRRRFIKSLVATLIQQHGREATLVRLQRAAKRSTGPRRRLTLDMIEEVERLEMVDAAQLGRG